MPRFTSLLFCFCVKMSEMCWSWFRSLAQRVTDFSLFCMCLQSCLCAVRCWHTFSLMCWLVSSVKFSSHSLVRAVDEMFSSVLNNQQMAGKAAHLCMQRTLV